MYGSENRIIMIFCVPEIKTRIQDSGLKMDNGILYFQDS
jgi:hypothetical protein